MINKYNIAELSLVDRPVGGTQTGFGSVINRFPGNHDQRHFETTQKDFHGEVAPADATQTVENFEDRYGKAGGGNTRPYEKQKVKTISNLCGEVYNQASDPQEKTDIQRTWMYHEDPGVSAVNQGKSGKP